MSKLRLMLREKSDDLLCRKMALKLCQEFNLEDVQVGTETKNYIKSISPSKIFCFGVVPLTVTLRLMGLKHRVIQEVTTNKDVFTFTKADQSILTVYKLPSIYRIIQGGKQELSRVISILQESLNV